jgi:hypothetical protein
MAVSLKHAFQSAKADGADASLVRPSNWNAEHTLTLAGSRLLGRANSVAGAAEEIVLGSGFSFSGTTLNFSTSTQLGYTPANRAGDTFTGQVTLSSTAPILRMQDTTASAYDARLRLDANNLYFDGSADGTTYSEVLRFEMDTKASYFTGMLNITGSEVIRLTGAGVTDPYVSFYQDTVRKAYIQYQDGTAVNQGLKLYNDAATGGDTALTLLNSGGVDSLEWMVNGAEYKVIHTGNIDTYDLAKYYAGSAQDQVDFPLGHLLVTAAGTLVNRNQTTTIRFRTDLDWAYTANTGTGAVVLGTWRQRGGWDGGTYQLWQRVA